MIIFTEEQVKTIQRALKDVQNAFDPRCNCGAGPNNDQCNGSCTYSQVNAALAVIERKQKRGA